MDVRRNHWGHGELSSNESSANDDRDTRASGDSTRTLIHSHSALAAGRMVMTRKNKVALITFTFVCLIGIVLGTGYIYLQHNFAQEMISRYDVNTVDEDGDDVPYAEAHTAVFIVSSDDSNSSDVAAFIFDPNTTYRPLPSNPYAKSPVSLLLELVIRPRPVFRYMECPIKRPSLFFRLNLTIGAGRGVTGYGVGKKAARRMAAEDALRELYNVSFTFPVPDCHELARRCGES